MLVWCNDAWKQPSRRPGIANSTIPRPIQSYRFRDLAVPRYLRRGRQPVAIDPGPLYCELHRSRISAWRKHGPQGRSTRLDFLEEQRERARKASQSGDWQGALNIWEMLRTGFLDASEIFIGRGDALQALGRLDEAEAAFVEAMELFPKSEWAAARHAGVAERRCDWPEAIRRWEDLANAFPNFSLGYIAKGHILQDLGNLDEAERSAAATIRPARWCGKATAPSSSRSRCSPRSRR
jgi:tetratricopeptide (TPR) repeat protein